MGQTLVQIARHCSAEDTETEEVYEVDGGDLVSTIKNAAVFIKQLEDAGKEFETEFHASTEPGDDYFEVVIFKVAK